MNMRHLLLSMVLLSAASPLGAQAVKDTLVRWDFERTTYDGRRQHAGIATDVGYEPGPRGDAITFNGKDARVAYPSHSLWTFDHRESFTIDFWIKTGQRPDTIATVMIAREAGQTPSWGFVLAGKSPKYNRRPGHLSFELWTWDRQRVDSGRRIDDGRWHHIEAHYHQPTRMAVLVVDDEITGGMVVDTNYVGPPARLVLGNNLSDPQPFEGALDSLALVRGVPERVADYANVRKKTRLMSRNEVAANYEAWLARMMTPRGVAARSRAEWDRRRPEVQRKVREALGLLPWPYTRSVCGDLLPLDVHEGGRLEYDDCTVQGLAWQTWDGVFARGLLYIPKRAQPPWPAMLNPHGHFSDGICAPEVHFRGMSLARQGYLALSVQSVHPEDLNVGLMPLSAMTWNNLRAVDFLAGRPDVDKTRIGCTGASGGGQQTLFMMCLDERIAAAVPAVYPSYFRAIMADAHNKPQMGWVHCNCNWVPGLLSFTDEPEIAAVFAPRPAYYITSAQDWTAKWAEEGYPEVQKVYRWYDASDRLGMKRFDEPHGYPRRWREEAYTFFHKHLQGGDGESRVREGEDFPAPDKDELLALLPDVPTADMRQILLAEEFKARLGKASVPRARDEAAARKAQYELRARLREILDEPFPEKRPSRMRTVLDERAEAHLLRVVRFHTEPEIEIPALLLTPHNSPRPWPLAIVIDGRGKDICYTVEKSLCQELLANNWAVLIPDVRAMGELAVDEPWPKAYGTLLGRADAAVGAHDVLEIVRAARTANEFMRDRITLFGIGEGTVPAMLAAALDEEIEGVACTDAGFTYMEDRETPLFPRAIAAGDLPVWSCLVAPRPLFLAGVHDEAPYAGLVDFYQASGGKAPLVTEERETAARPGLLAWHSLIRKAR